MKIKIVAGARCGDGEPPRSTAYYYADLERFKRNKNSGQNAGQDADPVQDENHQNPEELSEYVASSEVVNDGAVREVPPLRDRRQWSLPEYIPDASRKVPEETYSTAGTFPMPEPKEKEPLLAELEIVGRLPLTQLDSTSGVRRSRSWYLCCPNMGDEEVSRESSWRYSSLRPVTAAPLPGQNGLTLTSALSAGGDGLTVRGEEAGAATIRAERDALARALAAERQRAAVAARAHDARLAELHGVIAELVRRRAADKHAGTIPEEEVSDECESRTQLAGELDHEDASRTDQNETSSAVTPLELPMEDEMQSRLRDTLEDTTDTSSRDVDLEGADTPKVEVASPPSQVEDERCTLSLQLSERDSELCVNSARCCQYARTHHSTGGSCEREHGSTDDTRVYTASPGRCESRQAKLASRVRLKRAQGAQPVRCEQSPLPAASVNNAPEHDDQWWCAEAAERLALDVCAQADLREALVAATNDGSALSASVCAWRARCARLAADCRVLECALTRATDTAHRLSCACAVQESSCVSLCCALRAADRALETYDVLLALAETGGSSGPEREAAELVAHQLLSRLDAEQTSATIGESLLSPGPWLQHHQQSSGEGQAEGLGLGGWSAEREARLRGHAARLKSDTVTLRTLQPEPHLFSYHDVVEDELPKSMGSISMAEMEAAVMMQEVLLARECAAAKSAERCAAGGAIAQQHDVPCKTDSDRGRRGRRAERERPQRHWLETQASETDL